MNNKKQSTSTAIKPEATGLSTNDPALRALGEMQIEDNGLHEIDQSDIKLPTKTLNMKGTDRGGDEIPKAAYYDTVDETFKKGVAAVFVGVHKSNVFSRYNEGEGKTVIVCRSDDLKTGTMRESGLNRPCKGCPDAKWHSEMQKDGTNRNVRSCNEVHNVIAFDQDERKLFTIRFKKGALKEWRNHLNKHHLGKGKVTGLPWRDVPLFFYECNLTAALADAGTHAVPMFERGRVLSVEEVKAMSESATFIRERALDIAAASDEAGESVERPDTSFNPDEFSSGKGQDFVESPAAE